MVDLIPRITLALKREKVGIDAKVKEPDSEGQSLLPLSPRDLILIQHAYSTPILISQA
jgi:hypothetical protein